MFCNHYKTQIKKKTYCYNNTGGEHLEETTLYHISTVCLLFSFACVIEAKSNGQAL